MEDDPLSFPQTSWLRWLRWRNLFVGDIGSEHLVDKDAKLLRVISKLKHHHLLLLLLQTLNLLFKQIGTRQSCNGISSTNVFKSVSDPFSKPPSTFFVANQRLYNSLCLSIHLSIRMSVTTSDRRLRFATFGRVSGLVKSTICFISIWRLGTMSGNFCRLLFIIITR